MFTCSSLDALMARSGRCAVPTGGVVDRVTPDGRSSIAAGVLGCDASSCLDAPEGDGGLAIRAQMLQPVAVAATPDGGFVIADEGVADIRRVDAQGIITTLAGDSRPAADHSGPVGIGGLATEASLFRPRSARSHPTAAS